MSSTGVCIDYVQRAVDCKGGTLYSNGLVKAHVTKLG
jgi:hypothetical protein